REPCGAFLLDRRMESTGLVYARFMNDRAMLARPHAMEPPARGDGVNETLRELRAEHIPEVFRRRDPARICVSPYRMTAIVCAHWRVRWRDGAPQKRPSGINGLMSGSSDRGGMRDADN